jgi:hypothetical protein
MRRFSQIIISLLSDLDCDWLRNSGLDYVLTLSLAYDMHLIALE